MTRRLTMRIVWAVLIASLLGGTYVIVSRGGRPAAQRETDSGFH